MSIADELAKLDELRSRGVLSDAEFQQAKTRLLDGASRGTSSPGIAAINGFRRSLADRWIGGVCGGLGDATGIESWAWRLIFAVLLLLGGTGLILYVLLWIFVPAE
jgi:phage shock protein PspC (stress-responsive transcriptional regulator)